MNKDNYIIVNKTLIQKRIEKLEVWSKHNKKVGEFDGEGNTADDLREILSQSTPLIPEIEKAYFNGGDMKGLEEFNYYISHLKLEI